MMSCAGNSYLKTPNMDRLAKTGIRFERAYCTNPVCLPSRFSLFTGKYPSEIGVYSNDVNDIEIPPSLLKNGIGWQLKKVGYDVAYAGKQHFPRFTADDLGFNVISKNERDEMADTCAEYIKQKRTEPFFLAASFINPHDICYMAIRDNAENESEKMIIKNGKTELLTLDKAMQIPKGVSEAEFYQKICPPLPKNYEPQQNEPEAVSIHHNDRPFKKKAREYYTDNDWLMHRYAYCRLTEMVDAQIGKLLDALDSTGKTENTIIIFSSDHGDLDGAHRLEHKELMYEEACKIPLIISPSKIPNSTSNSLVSNGLDIIKTIFDFAGIPDDTEQKGQSLKPIVDGEEATVKRPYIKIEGEYGNAIVTEQYKYVKYKKGKNNKQLYDLINDKGEMRNAIQDPEKAGVVEKLKKIYKKR